MFKLDSRKIPNGAVLLMGISYAGMGQTDLDTTRGRQAPKVFTYAFLKAGNLWYATGGPKAPQAAGWEAVLRWLAKDNRTVVWVKMMTATADLWPVPSSPVDTSQATE